MAALSIYLDASVLVSLFIDDTFAARADKALRAAGTVAVISDYAATEFASSIARNFRMKLLTKSQANDVFSDFDSWSQSAVDIVEMDTSDVRSAETMLRRLDLTLRAPDAIHIAISQRIGARLATFDKKMADCARVLGASLAKI
jgi:uncharacterized protein